jgi:metallo-beta-lactamase family protein|tara:strand:+ start:14983 stop:16338 length:1356 start_codon:yes stop_codon:yes gene_type:complete
VKLKFLGATGTVTGSKYLIEHGNERVLIDCGLFQGGKRLRLRNWEKLPVDAKSITAVILTHAHIDHSGYLPRLVKDGFKGNIYSTPATRDLCKIMLPDCGHLMEEEARYANKRKYSKHKPALPLFTIDDAKSTLSQFHAVQYGEKFELGSGLSFNYSNAGHILGSAHVSISDGAKNIVFSGDIGRQEDEMMRVPEPPKHADYLLMESTYGNRAHPKSDAEEELAAIINRTIHRGGTIIVPAFAVGRAQLVLHYVSKLLKAGKISKFPIYLNSPMATNVTNVYCEHEYNHRLSKEECHEMCDVAQYVYSPEESKALNESPRPKLIISASGMATGGRVIHHIKAFGTNPKNTLLFAGFQAGGTRGEKIVSGAETVKIHGQEIPIRAEVCNLSHLSAHADQSELIDWAGGISNRPQKVFITHGEGDGSNTLKGLLEERLGWSCEVPEYLDEVDL